MHIGIIIPLQIPSHLLLLSKNTLFAEKLHSFDNILSLLLIKNPSNSPQHLGHEPTQIMVDHEILKKYTHTQKHTYNIQWCSHADIRTKLKSNKLKDKKNTDFNTLFFVF